MWCLGDGADTGSQKGEVKGNIQISSLDMWSDREVFRDTGTLPRKHCFCWYLKGKPRGTARAPLLEQALLKAAAGLGTVSLYSPERWEINH